MNRPTVTEVTHYPQMNINIFVPLIILIRDLRNDIRATLEANRKIQDSHNRIKEVVHVYVQQVNIKMLAKHMFLSVSRHKTFGN